MGELWWLHCVRAAHAVALMHSCSETRTSQSHAKGAHSPVAKQPDGRPHFTLGLDASTGALKPPVNQQDPRGVPLISSPREIVAFLLACFLFSCQELAHFGVTSRSISAAGPRRAAAQIETPNRKSAQSDTQLVRQVDDLCQHEGQPFSELEFECKSRANSWNTFECESGLESGSEFKLKFKLKSNPESKS